MLAVRAASGAFRRAAAAHRTALARSAAWPAASFSTLKHVAILQDQQIPKDHVVEAIENQDFAVEWCVEEQPSNAWAVCTVTQPVTAETLDRHPNCKLVAVSFTGFNHVDLEACRQRGIAVVNVPAYSTEAVAELSVGLTLNVFREMNGGERTLRGGGWAHSGGGMEIRNKVIGILGLGDIGIRTAKLFKAFEPKEMIGWSRKEKDHFEEPPIYGRHVGLEELFETADVVSCHVALNAATKGFVSRQLMEKLRPESVFVNVARGGVVDHKAMCELLAAKRFRAGLDVFETEPVPADDAIWSIPPDQVVLTPHVAYKTKEALAKRMQITAKNLRCFADGKPQNMVLAPSQDEEEAEG